MIDLRTLRTVVSLLLTVLLSSGIADGAEHYSEQSVGIFLYENLDGRHASSSLAGTSVSSSLNGVFGSVRVLDKVPLVSNESVRMLSAMTAGREVTISAIRTWMVGGIIQAPTITLADNAIKFRDLTWHLDQESCLAWCADQGLDFALVGSVTGRTNPVESVRSGGGRKPHSVHAVAGLQLIEIATQKATWTHTYAPKGVGFDPQIVFSDLMVQLGENIGRDIKGSIN